MDTFNSLLGNIIEYVTSTALLAFTAVSVALFISEAVKAKRQGRKMKTGIKVMFIIAMVLDAILVILGLLVLLLIFAYATSSL
jgi:ABC-type spermidine/putrescine transport system permease subunit II